MFYEKLSIALIELTASLKRRDIKEENFGCKNTIKGSDNVSMAIAIVSRDRIDSLSYHKTKFHNGTGYPPCTYSATRRSSSPVSFFGLSLCTVLMWRLSVPRCEVA